MKSMLIDMHVHSSLSSCSVLSLETILEQARLRGMDGVCITDHDTMQACSMVREGVQEDGFVVLVGMEYSTPQGDFLIFGPFEDIQTGMDARQLLPLVRESGGAAVGAHPYRERRPADETLFLKGLCSVLEGVNGRNSLSENMRAQALGRKLDITMTGGSDAHTLEELARFPTRFRKRVESRADLVAALRSGACEPAWLSENTGPEKTARCGS